MKKLNRFLVAAMAALIITPVMAMNVLADTLPGDDSETDKAIKIKIDSNNFPDKEFRTYIKNIDLNEESFDGDGYLSSSEIKLIKKIEIDKNENIKNITGVGNLTSLTTVSLTNCPLLEGELDLTGNANVKTITLKNDGISSINVNKDKITNLTIDGCPNMTGTFNLTSYTSLKKFEAKNSSFTKISMADTEILTSINISDSSVTSIGLKSCNELTYLNVSGTAVKSLNLSHCPDLATLNVSRTNVSELALNECQELRKLNVEDCSNLTSIDINMCDDLISCFEYGELQQQDGKTSYIGEDKYVKYSDELDINLPGLLLNEKNFPDEKFRYQLNLKTSYGNYYLNQTRVDNVTELWISGKGIKSLKGIEFFKNLDTLVCDSNRLTELDLSNNHKLKWLSCDNNDIQTLIFDNPSTLTYLNCDNTQISKLDLSGYSKLTGLYLDKCELLEELTLTGCQSLNEVYIGSPLLKKIDLTGNSYLNKITINGYGEGIEELLFDSKLFDLKGVDVKNTKLTSLKLLDMPVIDYLYLYNNNQMTDLTVNNCPKLSVIECNDNKVLENIDIKKEL